MTLITHVLNAAALIGLLEWCINRGPIRRAIERQFTAVSPTPQKLRQHVYQSNIRIIGLLHLAIQVGRDVVPCSPPRCCTTLNEAFLT